MFAITFQLWILPELKSRFAQFFSPQHVSSYCLAELCDRQWKHKKRRVQVLLPPVIYLCATFLSQHLSNDLTNSTESDEKAQLPFLGVHACLPRLIFHHSHSQPKVANFQRTASSSLTTTGFIQKLRLNDMLSHEVRSWRLDNKLQCDPGMLDKVLFYGWNARRKPPFALGSNFPFFTSSHSAKWKGVFAFKILFKEDNMECSIKLMIKF